MGKKIKDNKIKANKSDSPVRNGDKVKDKITGMEGIVTGVVDYITGCNQALISPKATADGGYVDSRWFDVDRLEVTEAGVIQVENVTSAARPGADKPAPTK